MVVNVRMILLYKKGFVNQELRQYIINTNRIDFTYIISSFKNWLSLLAEKN